VFTVVGTLSKAKVVVSRACVTITSGYNYSQSFRCSKSAHHQPPGDVINTFGQQDVHQTLAQTSDILIWVHTCNNKMVAIYVRFMKTSFCGGCRISARFWTKKWRSLGPVRELMYVCHIHHDSPMDLTERMNRHIWGVEATSHKITAENHVFCRFSVWPPSVADFVLF
jgi:hypothetical protein